jgi:hypothetical protein
VLENRVLRTIFGPKTDEVTGKWSRLHNQELNDLYSSHSSQVIKSRRMRWAGNLALWGTGEVHAGFDGEARGNEALGRSRHK